VWTCDFSHDYVRINADQDEYLAIAGQWLASFGLDGEAIAGARAEALVWALERGSRSGRVAYQFARDYAGRRGG
jgi:predicted AAA+ superfamily ATPase